MPIATQSESHINRQRPTEADLVAARALLPDHPDDMTDQELHDLIGLTLYNRGMFSGAAIQTATDLLSEIWLAA